MTRIVKKQCVLFTIIAITILFLLSTSAFGQHKFVYTFYFNFNSYKINKQYFNKLNDIGNMCMTDSLQFMKIFAFTDTTGSIKCNDELAKKRAYQVYNYLISKFSIDTTKIYITWLGEDADIYDLHYPEAHAQQRCVDIIANFKKRSN